MYRNKIFSSYKLLYMFWHNWKFFLLIQHTNPEIFCHLVNSMIQLLKLNWELGKFHPYFLLKLRSIAFCSPRIDCLYWYALLFCFWMLNLGQSGYLASILQGFDATLTAPMDSLGRRGGHIREMDLKLHPELEGPLKKLCDDPRTTVIVLSGSDRSVLDEVLLFPRWFIFCLLHILHWAKKFFLQNFGDYNMWLAAENGMFLRLTAGEWMTTMPENLNMDWVDSVKVYNINSYVKTKYLCKLLSTN